jgi:DnaJ-domain-containing protein 1
VPHVDDALQLQAGTALVPGRPADDALLGLLASMACSDGEVHEAELDFLSKVRADLSGEALRSWALQHAGPVDPEAIAAAVTSPDDQWKTLRFAARMAWKDGELAPEEQSLLEGLAKAMRMPDGAVQRVLAEMAPDTGERYQSDRLLRTVMDIHWDAVQLAGGGLVSEDLCAVLPDGNKVVARVGLDKVEVMALCTGGLVARFQEGAAFIGWGELVTYTRSFGLGASIQLHTEDGRVYSLVDSRLTGIGPLLDRLLADRTKPRGEAPVVQTRRGES